MKENFIPLESIREESAKQKIAGTGVVLGKFYPPHLGHSRLIEAALETASAVTVIVVDRDDHTIPGDLRAKWISENHPVFVRVIKDTYPEWDSKLWADLTIKWLRYVPEFTFTSEDYGERWARLMNSTHVLVDRERTQIPVSGTQVRENPMGNLEFLKPNVQKYYQDSFSSK